jgi:glutaredoxin
MGLCQLWAWWKGRASPTPPLEVVLYTRPGCHLCDEARARLNRERRRHRFRLTEVNVDSDPDLAGRYGDRVPVVTVGGKLRFRGGVNRVLLARLLRGEGRRPG